MRPPGPRAARAVDLPDTPWQRGRRRSPAVPVPLVRGGRGPGAAQPGFGGLRWHPHPVVADDEQGHVVGEPAAGVAQQCGVDAVDEGGR
ncbi:hypothetical protein GCM10017752_56530 [Streptomyces roseoviridis]